MSQIKTLHHRALYSQISNKIDIKAKAFNCCTSIKSQISLKPTLYSQTFRVKFAISAVEQSNKPKRVLTCL
ncbi:hypothetical protein DXX92_11390 [Thalassotalea euphylliae]|uniref:Uncharacterized protein n=1 Tax=Thalassotalea euphylliae TaxID=1655234 RepID=A0A3E0UFU5_9GAMM|nr:hypothetical protein DXX92_11390 [Thalassotalea euphylliae]